MVTKLEPSLYLTVPFAFGRCALFGNLYSYYSKIIAMPIANVLLFTVTPHYTSAVQSQIPCNVHSSKLHPSSPLAQIRGGVSSIPPPLLPPVYLEG